MAGEILDFTKEAGLWVYEEARTKVVAYKRRVKQFSVWLAGAFLLAAIMIIVGNAFGGSQLVNTAKFLLVLAGAIALIMVLPPLIGLYLAYRYSQIGRGIIIFICGLFLSYFLLATYFLFLPVEKYPALAAVGIMALISLFLSYLVLGAKVNPKYIIAWRWAILVVVTLLIIFPNLYTVGAFYVEKINVWLGEQTKPPVKPLDPQPNPNRIEVNLSNIDLLNLYDWTGKNIVFYCSPSYGVYEFFDSQVFCPRHGKKLKPVTDKVIKRWKQLLEIERQKKEKEQGEIKKAEGEIVIPAGTILSVRLMVELDTVNNKRGDEFRAYLDQPIILDGETVVEKGVIAHGTITDVRQRPGPGQSASLAVSLHWLIIPEAVSGQVDITTKPLRFAHPESREESIKKSVYLPPDCLAEFELAAPLIFKRSKQVIQIGSVSSSQAEGVYNVGGGVTAPVAVVQPFPSYTEAARQARIKGNVLPRNPKRSAGRRAMQR